VAPGTWRLDLSFQNDPMAPPLNDNLTNDQRISALGALYQAEKSDASGMFNVAMTVMAIGAAYIVGALGYTGNYGTRSLPWILVALAPAPLWIIAAFQSILTLTSMMHGVSVQILEDALFQETGLASGLRNYVGSKGADQIQDIRESAWPNSIATVFIYTGVGGSVLGFTTYAIDQAWNHLSQGTNIGLIVGYLLAAAIVVLSWVFGLSRVSAAAAWRKDVSRQQSGMIQAAREWEVEGDQPNLSSTEAKSDGLVEPTAR
jgi:hypothetical protein